MATTPFYLQQFRFLDDSPASGGKLYAFLQGTETPAAVYLDAGLSAPAPNPIILGADGVVPQFFVPPINGYAFRLTDPRNGVETTVWTRDYVAQGETVNGTVTSVGLNPPDLMSVTGSPIASSGTLVMEWIGDAEDVVLADGTTAPAAGLSTPAEKQFWNDKADLIWIRSNLGNGAAPPSSPQTGDTHWIAAGNTGTFSAWEYGFVRWTGTEWIFIERITKQIVWLSDNPANDEGSLYQVLSVGGGIYFLVMLYHTIVKARALQIGADVSLSDYSHPNNYGKIDKGEFSSGTGAGLFFMSQGSSIPSIVMQEAGGGAAATSLNAVSSELRVKGFSDSAPQDGGVWKDVHAKDFVAEGVVKTAGSVRLDAAGAGYLTALSISGLSDGYIPRVTTAGGLLGNSSLSEDATSVKSAKPLTLNGATRPAWALWDAPIQLSNLAAIYTITGTGGQVGFARNFYINAAGEKIAIVSGTGIAYPSQLHVDDNGRLRFYASQTSPVAGSPVTDVGLRFEVNRFGGVGFFGVSAPSTRPTVNAACTDLATCIALTNQLRTHLIACGLVQ